MKTPIPTTQSLEETYHLPTSYAQERIWVLYQLNPETSAYNIPFALRLKGQLNREVLGHCFDTLVRRHESLRTTFVEHHGTPVQVVSPPYPVQMPIVDLESIPEEERNRQVMEMMREDAKKPFDLSKGPLWRVRLIRLQKDEHLLSFNVHHIIFDGWSMNILLEELNLLYGAYKKGETHPLRELALQYADYAEWQKKWFETAEMKRQLSFWEKQLGGERPRMHLPTDRPRPAQMTFRGAVEAFRLSPTILKKLMAVSQQEGATLFMTLLTVYKTLLFRYTGQTDLLVGAPIANRLRPEVEGIIGFFANTLVFRTELNGDISFRELLGRVRQRSLDIYANQDVPFEKLVEHLQPERDLSYNPLFQVLFSFRQDRLATGKIGELRSEYVRVENDTAKFDLSLNMIQVGDSLIGEFEYSTDLFDRETIQRMKRHFIQLIESAVAQPDSPVSCLPMLSEEEQKWLLDTLNDTEVDFGEEQHGCLHHLFEKQVSKTPDHIAAECGPYRITYQELEERSNRLAHYLRERGVGPDVPVGVHLDRSIDLVVALLGVLKAGGAYLPLDTEAPVNRVRQILQDANAPVCLIQKHFRHKFGADAKIICLDRDRAAINSCSSHRLQITITGSHLVSIYYTSGSTGKPKGVASTHRGWVNRMLWMQHQHGLLAGERVLQKTVLTFDDAAVEFFWPLMVGARIVLMEPGLHRDPRAILDEAIRSQVAVLQFVPSMLAMVLDQITPEDREKLSHLRVVVSSGEALRSELVRKFLDCMPGCLTNTWGATEVSIDSTIHICSKEDVYQGDIVSIGRPIANNRVYVLDRYMQPVPVGVPGDLYLGGIGLARGYLNDPQRTRKAFLNNPFIPGERLYKTGDRGYFRRDGSLCFLGREDNQVKLRGMRVELGEIENVLCLQEQIREAVVRVVGDDSSMKYLVAYVIPASGCSPTPTEIRDYLSENLPKYMIPAHTIIMERFPLTPNGKVDRRSLPLPDRRFQEESREFVPPRNATEELIAGIWAQLLQLDQVGSQEDFFELGGHSLLGVQVMSRIQQAFDVKLPLKVLFDGPTVAQLAKEVKKQRLPATADQHRLTPARRRENLPASYSQKRLWFLDQLESGSSVYNMTDCLHIQGDFDVDIMRRSLHEVIRRHESLRTHFCEMDGDLIQVIVPELELDVPMVDLTSLPENERWEAAMQHFDKESQFQFDLERGPLIRARLIRLSERDHILILNIHHIVYDGWSVGILRKELLHIYEAFSQDKKPDLPDRVFQYADYAIWQKTVQEEGMNQSLDYWKKKLAGDLPVLQLPMKPLLSDPDAGSYEGAACARKLPKELVRQLRKVSAGEGATLFMTLLAAFKILLHRYTDQDDLLVGIPVANRNREEWEDVIGLFLNTLVIRSDLSGNPDFRIFLQRIRRGLLEAYTHQDVPFEKIVEEVQPHRSLHRNPVFDVLVNHVRFHHADEKWTTSSLQVDPVDDRIPESKFFMTLYIKEAEEEVQLKLVYRTSLFDDKQMDRMMGQFEFLLEQVAKDPSLALTDYSLVREETGNLLPDPSVSLTRKSLKRVTHLIREWAQTNPDRTAVSQGGTHWTYQMLMERSRVIAGALVRKGITPGQVVAVVGSRSFDYIAAMIGVWLAKGILVTLDNHLPVARFQLLLEESQAHFLISVTGSESHAIDWAREKGIVSLDLSQEEPDFSTGRLIETEDRDATDEAAYIFFTSGTMGKPKGVMGTHEGLSHFLLWQRETFEIGMDDCGAQLTNSSFDVFLRDVFMPLISGARISIPNVSLQDDWSSDSILNWMKREEVTLLHTVPSIAESWLRSSPNTDVGTIRWVFFAGEPLTGSLIRRWRSVFGSKAGLVNLYGPTETTLAKCWYVIPENVPQGILPVGMPLPQTQALVVNRAGRLCGVGEVGEVVIRTPYQTLGYIHGETGGFADNPFIPGERIYYTGDQGRYRADGTLEILGRIDDQIKVRGVRINRSEVEAVLSEHPEVRSCMVMDWKGGSGVVLVAYVVRFREEAVTGSDLRGYLRNRLPEAMVPSAFLFIKQIPLTPNGKVDRKQLPDPADIITDKEMTPPRTPLEREIAEVWKEVLQMGQVGVEDHFFEMGGHSLLATQIIASLRNRYGIHLHLKHLFESPTIAGLADIVEQQRKKNKVGVSRIKRLSRDDHRIDPS